MKLPKTSGSTTRVFLDTNILLDIIEGRQQFLLASSNVFDLGIRGQIQIFATPLTFANCVYTARKNVGYEQAVKGLKILKSYVQTAPMDDVQVTDALNSDMPDFEDMLQYEAAYEAGCDLIITRNKKHFPNEVLQVLEPTEFFNMYWAID